MKSKPTHFQVQIYYEDTDHSGVVYHANYLKYFERALENLIGTEALVELWAQRCRSNRGTPRSCALPLHAPAGQGFVQSAA